MKQDGSEALGVFVPFIDGKEVERKHKEKDAYSKVRLGCVRCLHRKKYEKVIIYTALSPYPPPSPDVLTLVSDCARAAKAAKRRTTSASTLSQRSDRV